ncbi:MAG TPA: exopolyphosphatase [Ruminococcaceae bacterium]|nr:exopolyphosphatase [Oscillospiraceae bacterium]
MNNLNRAANISLEEAAKFLLSKDRILILSHANPDGDTFGCSYGLCGALQKLGKSVKIACADPLPANFFHLKEAVREQDFEEETVVSVDIADKSLLGGLEKLYGDKVDLAIDHHLSHVPFARLRYVDDEAAACCEIVYDLIKLLGAEIDKNIAQCVYTGIATDTGCFKYANTTRLTHIKAGELMNYGFDCGELNYRLFDMKSRARIKLEQFMLAHLDFFAEGKGAIVALNKELLNNVDSEDINGISALPRMIEGVDVGIVLKEKEDCWKASMRSLKADVQKICKKFGGGGHLNAAGCSFKNMTAEEITEKIKAAVCRELGSETAEQ